MDTLEIKKHSDGNPAAVVLSTSAHLAHLESDRVAAAPITASVSALIHLHSLIFIIISQQSQRSMAATPSALSYPPLSLVFSFSLSFPPHLSYHSIFPIPFLIFSHLYLYDHFMLSSTISPSPLYLSHISISTFSFSSCLLPPLSLSFLFSV